MERTKKQGKAPQCGADVKFVGQGRCAQGGGECTVCGHCQSHCPGHTQLRAPARFAAPVRRW